MSETATAIEQFIESFVGIITTYGFITVQAILILVVGWWLAARLGAATRRRLDRFDRLDATLKPLFASLVRYSILVVTIIAVLAQFGVQTASIIAVVGAAGLAIGLALQGTLQNIAAGIMLLFLRPFKVGDAVAVAGSSGTVQELSLFNTEFRTADGICIFVPNASIWGATITNYSRNTTRRMDIVVGVAYDDDIGTALQVLMDLMTGDSRVLADPAPATMVTALADSSVNITMRCWANSSDYWDLLWDLNRKSKEAIEAAGCSIPFPQRDVHLIPLPEKA